MGAIGIIFMMITIYVGDDTALSRAKYQQSIRDYKSKHYYIASLTKESLLEVERWLASGQTLFEEKKAFFGENLLSKKESRDAIKKLQKQYQCLDFVIWEEQFDERSAKAYFKTAQIVSCRLSFNVFKLLDSIYPKNIKKVLSLLAAVSKTVDQNIILAMLEQRARDLILVKGGQVPKKKLANWQLNKLRQQAAYWSTDKLIVFYDTLYRIEYGIKTGSQYYSIKDALDIAIIYSL